MANITSKVNISLATKQDPVSEVLLKGTEGDDYLVTVLPNRWWKKLTANKMPEKLENPTEKDLFIAFFLFVTLIHEASHLKVSIMSSTDWSNLH